MSCVKSSASTPFAGEFMSYDSVFPSQDERNAFSASGRAGGGEIDGVAAASGRGAALARRKKPASVPSPKRQSGFFVPATWVLLAFSAWALVVGERAEVVRLAPATAPIYAALGLKVNLRRMDIEKVASKLVEADGRKFLVVEGEIHNLSRSPRTAPPMRLAVLDQSGREIYYWTASPQKTRLDGGETAFFRARLASPPAEGRKVLVRFASGPRRAGFGT